jgi:hypothetical protein
MVRISVPRMNKLSRSIVFFPLLGCLCTTACVGMGSNIPVTTLVQQVTIEKVFFTLTPTITPSPTMTPTITPTLDIAREIQAIYQENIEEDILGVPVKVELITDRSLAANQFLPINKISTNPAFGKNGFGETSSQALARVAAEGLYLAWQKNGTAQQVAQRRSISFGTFLSWWKESAQGKRPWSDVELQVFANDRATREYDPKYMTIQPGAVSIVFLDGNVTNNLTKNIVPERFVYLNMGRDVTSTFDESFGTQVNNGNLEIWIAFPYYIGGNMNRMGEIIIPRVLTAIQRLSWAEKDQGNRVYDERAVDQSACWLYQRKPINPWQWNRTTIAVGEGHYKTILAMDPADDPWNSK